MLRTGVDIVHVPRFPRLMDNPAFLAKVFHPSEQKKHDAQHLAGLFAAKEAFFKAIDDGPRWLDIEIKKKATGRPMIVMTGALKDAITECDLSISHDHEYAIAHVVLVTR